MHEFGIAQGLLEVVLAKAHENCARHVESVKLEIGALSGVEDEALIFAFTALSAGTEAEHAKLLIDKIPIRCRCNTCGHSFDCKALAYDCPTCGNISSDVIAGKEMSLVSMEVN